MWLGCRLQLIFATAPAASKYTTHFKSGQKWFEKYNLALTF